jgi:DNA-directed RNA polymerase subunit RPC12/RpoP
VVEYVCAWCGFAGIDPDEDLVDHVQCPQCGELVLPLEPGSGLLGAPGPSGD